MKRVLLLLCLLLLVSCGSDDVKTESPAKQGTTETAPEKQEQVVETMPEKEEIKAEENKKQEDGEKPSANTATETPTTEERTPEQQVMDKKLVMLLREQLAGAYDVAGAKFTYTCTEELEGIECFAYKMEKDGVSEIFAVATDSSAIFHLDGKDFVRIFG